MEKPRCLIYVPFCFVLFFFCQKSNVDSYVSKEDRQANLNLRSQKMIMDSYAENAYRLRTNEKEIVKVASEQDKKN